MSKTVIILGASSSIGRLVVDKYISCGWIVLAYCYKNNPFHDVTNKNSIKVTNLDLSDIDCVTKHLSEANFSNVSSIINCVGKIFPLSYSESNYEAIIKSLNINVLAASLFIKKLIPHMIKKRFGRIVHLGSIGVKYGGGMNNYPYALSKHLLEFFPSEIKNNSKNNVLCNTIRVGFVESNIHKDIPNKNINHRISLIPIGRPARPEEMIEMIYYFGSELNSYSTCEVITIAGGE